MKKQKTRSAGKDVGKLEPLNTVGGNAKLCSHYRTQQRDASKIKRELPHNPAISLLRIYPKYLILGSRRDVNTPVFIATLFTIARLWKQPKCPLMDKWIKKMQSIYNGILLSLEKEGNLAIYDNMALRPLC